MTPYYDHPEWAAWLASIREKPDDDHRRLFCADWLDELETDEARQRADFIRVQCELKRIHKPVFRKITGEDPSTIPDPLVHRHAKLRTREHEVLDWFCREDMAGHFGLPNHEGIHPSLHGIVCPSHGCEFTFNRGFVTRVSAPLAALHGGVCLRCTPRRRMARQIEQSEGLALGYPARGLADDLMALYDQCPNCVDGRTHGVLGELLKREPITAVGIEVTDKEPRHAESLGKWHWVHEGNPHAAAGRPDTLPVDLWETDLISKPIFQYHGRRAARWFDSEDASRLALGKALFRLHGPKSEVTT